MPYEYLEVPHQHFIERRTKMESCIVCDSPVEKGYAWYLGFIFCSQPCVDEWNDLSYEDQKRYIECQHALEALNGGWYATTYLAYVFPRACLGGICGLDWLAYPWERNMRDRKGSPTLRCGWARLQEVPHCLWQGRGTPAVGNHTRRKSNTPVEPERDLTFTCLFCKQTKTVCYGRFGNGKVCSRTCNDSFEATRFQQPKGVWFSSPAGKYRGYLQER